MNECTYEGGLYDARLVKERPKERRKVTTAEGGGGDGAGWSRFRD